MSRGRTQSPEVLAALVTAAANGDSGAWAELVDRHMALLWSITRGYGLSTSDCGDAIQTAWLRLLEHVHRLEDPSRVTAWLATTTRRECLRLLGLRNKVVLAGDELEMLEEWEPTESAAGMIAAEDAQQVRAALEQLPDRWRALMTMLMADPAPSYDEVSRTLHMPVGSIGPTRGRCLARLRTLVEP